MQFFGVDRRLGVHDFGGLLLHGDARNAGRFAELELAAILAEVRSWQVDRTPVFKSVHGLLGGLDPALRRYLRSDLRRVTACQVRRRLHGRVLSLNLGACRHLGDRERLGISLHRGRVVLGSV